MSSKASKYLNEILDSATNGQTNENSAAGESLLLTSLFSPANILASSVVAKPVMTSALTKPLQTTSVAPYLAQTYQPVVVKSWQTAVYSASIGTATTVKPYQPKYKHLNEIDRVPIYRTKYKQSSGYFWIQNLTINIFLQVSRSLNLSSRRSWNRCAQEGT
jgi:hypothetical protein